MKRGLAAWPLLIFPLLWPSAAGAQTPEPRRALPEGAAVTQLMLRLADAESKRRARANHLPPAERLQHLGRVAGLSLRALRPMSGGLHVLALPQSMSPQAVESVLKRLRADPSVELAEPVRRVWPTLAPDDADYGRQWHLYAPVGGIRAPLAWDWTTGAEGVVVAVLDTGVLPHPDLAARLLPGYDLVSDPYTANDGDGRDGDAGDPGDWVPAGPDTPEDCAEGDSSWHGTHVAGIVGATANNGAGVAGVDWRARLLPVRVLGRCGGSSADVIDAIRWAAGLPVPGLPLNPHPARVLNVSLGGLGPCSAAEQQAIDDAVSRGAVVVVAAGNDGLDASGFSPANCRNVVTVGASNGLGGRASYSNQGSALALSAPGGDFFDGGIYSTYNDGQTVPGNPTYGAMQGTSMATPVVSGVVAMMLARNPDLTPSQIASLLRTTARPFGQGGCTVRPGQCGAGIVDAAAAVQAAGGVRGDFGGGARIAFQTPWFSMAPGYISRFVFVNSAASPATFSITLISEDGNVPTPLATSATIPASGQLVLNANDVVGSLSVATRAAAAFTFDRAAAASVRGLYQIVNPATGSVSNTLLTQPGAESVSTALQTPWFSTAPGYISRFVLSNRGTADAQYFVTLLTEGGNIATPRVTSGRLPAGRQTVINASDLVAGFSGATRAAAVFTVTGSGADIAGLSQIVNPATGSVSNTAMKAPETVQTSSLRLIVPWFSVAQPYISRFVFTNRSAAAARYTARLLVEPGNAAEPGELTGVIPGRGQRVLDASAMVKGFSGRPRGAAVFDVVGDDAAIEGVYQLVNPLTGSVSNALMARPGVPTASVTLQSPWFSTASGYVSRFVFSNSGSEPAPFTVSLITESGNTAYPANTMGDIPANAQYVLDVSEIVAGFSGATRAAALFEINGSAAAIQGLYQIVNPVAGSVSNTLMERIR